MAVGIPANWETNQLQFAVVDIAATGDIVAAVAGKQIVVVSYVLVNKTATTTITWSDGAVASLTGAMTTAAGGVINYGGPTPAFATTLGTKLTLTLSANTQVSGHVTYYTV